MPFLEPLDAGLRCTWAAQPKALLHSQNQRTRKEQEGVKLGHLVAQWALGAPAPSGVDRLGWLMLPTLGHF